MSQLKVRSLFLTSIITTICSLSAIDKPAEAGTLYRGWNYAIDSFNDATARLWSGGPTDVGGNIFEIFGLAIKDDVAAGKISVAINANLPKQGATVPYATGYGHTGWGDMFFHTSQGVFGINFTTNNDSAARTTGVYKNVTAKSVALANDGWSTNRAYTNFVNSHGGRATMGDLAQSASPFGNSTKSLIASGNKIGDIFAADFTGLDFGRFGARGTQTFGFSFARSLLPTGDFIASLFQECFNDAIALKGFLPAKPKPVPPPVLPKPQPTPPVQILPSPTPEPAHVPEPTSMLALGAFSVVLLLQRKGKSTNSVTPKA